MKTIKGMWSRVREGYPIFLLMILIFVVVLHTAHRDWNWTYVLWATLLTSGTLVEIGPGGPRRLPAGDPSKFVLLRWMDIAGPSSDTAKDQELYLRRLYVLRTPKFGVMLHWIKREDWDRDALHNHPWTFWRLILSGGYTEELAWAKSKKKLGVRELRSYGMGQFNKFPEGAYHRITEVKPHTVSLVFTGPKKNAWGFFVPGEGHTGWRDYVSPGGGAR